MNASSTRTKGRPSPETPGAPAARDVGGQAPATNSTGIPSASVEAKRVAAAILEVLAGARGPCEAAQVLGISLARYYQLENRAIAGLVSACEPRRRGRGCNGPINELAALRQECQRLRRDCARHRALVRAAERTVGLNPSAGEETPAPAVTGKKRRRKPVARALKMAAMLQGDPADASVSGVESAAVSASDNPDRAAVP
jgi:hypothetical protein